VTMLTSLPRIRKLLCPRNVISTHYPRGFLAKHKEKAPREAPPVQKHEDGNWTIPGQSLLLSHSK
jgi:hypothetical protein